MLLDQAFAIPISLWLWLLLAIAIARLVSTKYHNGLNTFNGPFLASFTDLSRVLRSYRNRDKVTDADVVASYGDVVRTGPKSLLFAQAEAVKEIYNSGYQKSAFYKTAAGVKGVAVPNLFSSTDQDHHARLRRSVANAFAMSTLVQYEPFVNKTIDRFLREMDRRFAGKEGEARIIDFSKWLHYYAVDAIGELTYSAPHGCLEAGEDVGGIIASMQKFLLYVSLVGNMPILDSLFWKNPILLWLGRRGWYNKPSPTIPFAVKHLTQRLRAAKQTTDGEGTSSIGEGKREDLMAKFLNAKRDHPETVDDKEMLGMAISMVNAGSDTTAITLSAIFYYLLKNLRCLHKLVEELDSRLPTAEKSPKDSFKIYAPSFSDTQKLPYLDACINEGFRIHPALGGQPIERIVPKSGTTICGSWAPGGTQVACSPWVLHRNTAIYGEDVEAYRPERWLDDSPERVAAMQRTLFQFGGGAHTYIGKNISLLEIYKLVPSVLRAFEVTLANPEEKEWKIHNVGFIEPYDFFVRIKRRQHT